MLVVAGMGRWDVGGDECWDAMLNGRKARRPLLGYMPSLGCDVEWMRWSVGYSLGGAGGRWDARLGCSGDDRWDVLLGCRSRRSLGHEREDLLGAGSRWDATFGCRKKNDRSLSGWVHERPVGRSLDANGTGT